MAFTAKFPLISFNGQMKEQFYTDWMTSEVENENAYMENSKLTKEIW